MTWRGSTTTSDRIFACLPYLWLLIEILSIGASWGHQGFRFGIPMIRQFPWLDMLLSPLKPLVGFYFNVTSKLFLANLIVFFSIYFGVVRNVRVPHFIRFNAMQALLIDFVVFAIGLFIPLTTSGFVVQSLVNGIFLTVFVSFCYAIFQTLLGKYAEIPPLSDAVYIHVRD